MMRNKSSHLNMECKVGFPTQISGFFIMVQLITIYGYFLGLLAGRGMPIAIVDSCKRGELLR